LENGVVCLDRHDLELAIRMRASYEVGQVDYSTQEIAELIKIFDHVLKVFHGLRRRDLLHHSIAALYRYRNEIDEAFRMCKVLVANYSRRLALLRRALEAIPEVGIIEDFAEGVVICFPTGR
jgi:hypothetical protein